MEELLEHKLKILTETYFVKNVTMFFCIKSYIFLVYLSILKVLFILQFQSKVNNRTESLLTSLQICLQNSFHI